MVLFRRRAYQPHSDKPKRRAGALHPRKARRYRYQNHQNRDAAHNTRRTVRQLRQKAPCSKRPSGMGQLGLSRNSSEFLKARGVIRTGRAKGVEIQQNTQVGSNRRNYATTPGQLRHRRRSAAGRTARRQSRPAMGRFHIAPTSHS